MVLSLSVSPIGAVLLARARRDAFPRGLSLVTVVLFLVCSRLVFVILVSQQSMSLVSSFSSPSLAARLSYLPSGNCLLLVCFLHADHGGSTVPLFGGCLLLPDNGVNFFILLNTVSKAKQRGQVDDEAKTFMKPIVAEERSIIYFIKSIN